MEKKEFRFGKKNRLRYPYRNWTLVSVPDNVTWFRSYTKLTGTHGFNTESIKNGNPFNSIFLSLDQVSAIVHSPIGNYVATLEGRPGEKGAAVRIYCNW